jgi:ketosteroid isomerase-like protein
MADDVEVVRRVLDAFTRADVDAVLEASSEDFEFDFSNSRGPLSGVYRGVDEARTFFESFLEPWAALDVETEEFIELGRDRYLTVSEIRTRGQGSGAEVNARGALVWTVRGGEVAALKLYQSKEEALEAVSAQR